MKARRLLLVGSLALALALWALPAVADDDVAEPPGEILRLHPIVSVLANAFGFVAQEVAGLHETGMGFGVIFKLLVIAQVTGEPIDRVLAGLTGDDDELELGWGQWKRQLKEGELGLLQDLPKNLGQIVSAARRAQHAGKPPRPDPPNPPIPLEEVCEEGEGGCPPFPIELGFPGQVHGYGHGRGHSQDG